MNNGGSCLLDFDSFTRRHGKGHLIAVALPTDFRPADLNWLGRCLRKLIDSLPPAGDYATGMVRTVDDAQFHCRFADAEDARATGACLGARPTAAGGFATQRRILLNEALFAELRRTKVWTQAVRPPLAEGRCDSPPREG